MDEHGRLQDVYIIDEGTVTGTDGVTRDASIRVWADEGLKEKFMAIPGIHRVSDFRTKYFIDLDPRYDREFLKAEIEAIARL